MSRYWANKVAFNTRNKLHVPLKKVAWHSRRKPYSVVKDAVGRFANSEINISRNAGRIASLSGRLRDLSAAYNKLIDYAINAGMAGFGGAAVIAAAKNVYDGIKLHDVAVKGDHVMYMERMMNKLGSSRQPVITRVQALPNADSRPPYDRSVYVDIPEPQYYPKIIPIIEERPRNPPTGVPMPDPSGYSYYYGEYPMESGGHGHIPNDPVTSFDPRRRKHRKIYT